MIRLQVDPEYYDIGDVLFKYKSITFNPGVTVLVGCNGSGKSTLLRILKRHCYKTNISCEAYDDVADGRSNGTSKLAFSGMTSEFANDVISSEGEKIHNNIGRFAMNLREVVINNDKSVLLFDGIDSGQSIDGLLDVENLFDLILKDASDADRECYIVVTANSYELASKYKCVDVTTGKRRTFRSYNAYKNFVLKSSEYKQSRYSQSNL